MNNDSRCAIGIGIALFWNVDQSVHSTKGGVMGAHIPNPETDKLPRKRLFSAGRLDESVWQQVLKIADKNEDFKRRLKALGLLDD